jgi:TatD DNase family protein
VLIDSHCHLDASEFDLDRNEVIGGAKLSGIIVPAVHVANFDTVRTLAHNHAGLAYCLGIHPMYVQHARDEDLAQLEAALSAHIGDPNLVAVGEIGLDFFVPEIRAGAERQRQEYFYEAQLKLARKFQLPVILHVRRSQDNLLKFLRRVEVCGGIAHAFNGSRQQADAFVERGFCLGFGGAMTYQRALQIRRLAQTLPESAIVLETDSPDIPPEWLQREFLAQPLEQPLEQRVERQHLRRNSPVELPRIAQCLAALRATTPEHVASFTGANVVRVLPRMRKVLLPARSLG